ncbi:MAG: RHS repeat domain-containing protein [Kiritimatiellia bacterium]
MLPFAVLAYAPLPSDASVSPARVTVSTAPVSDGFTYDPVGNLTNRADGAGNTVRYAYDALDRLVARDAFGHDGHQASREEL